MLLDWLITVQIVPANPAAAVRGPKHVVKTGKTPVLEGCSSHSGRRTFIISAARNVHRVGCSLRDMRLLAGHSSIETTQAYINGATNGQRRLVSLL